MGIKSVAFISTIILGAYIAWGIWGYNLSLQLLPTIENINDDGFSRLGQWGDSFGAFNALFSAGGFALILATLVEQGKATRDQARDLHKQRFESSFFELLKLMRELRKDISFTHSKEFIVGNMLPAMTRTDLEQEKNDALAIQACIREMHFWLASRGIATKTTKNDMVYVYMGKIHSKSEATLGPYFRVIYSILKRLSTDKILTENEKVEYGNLLRSQLTSPEIILIAVNALAPISNDFGKFIKEFRMLKYMTGDAWRKRLMPLHPSQAFAGRDES